MIILLKYVYYFCFFFLDFDIEFLLVNSYVFEWIFVLLVFKWLFDVIIDFIEE